MSAATASSYLPSRLAPSIEAWSGLTTFLEKGAGAALDLAIRLWLAQIFFVSGMLKTVNSDITVFLYTNEHPVPGLDPATAALIGTGIELLCPFLVFGIATRFAAIPMLLTAAFLQFTYKELADHLFWMALLGFLILRGPGAHSLDYFIAPHLERSAIPFGHSLCRIAAFLARFCCRRSRSRSAFGSLGSCGASRFGLAPLPGRLQASSFASSLPSASRPVPQRSFSPG